MTGSDGTTAITDAHVFLRTNGDTSANAKTGPDGRFSFSNIAPGNYTIGVYKREVMFGPDTAVNDAVSDREVAIRTTSP